MKKTIAKHIEKKNFVKLFIVDKDGSEITKYYGFIFEQNDDFILMSETYDFIHEGFVIIRKQDISEICFNDISRHQMHILKSENRITSIYDRKKELGLSLMNYAELFNVLMEKNLSVVVECNYGNGDTFSLGTVHSVKKKKVKINYISAVGEYDFKPVTVAYDQITVVRFDNEYANLIHKHAILPD